MLEALEAGRGDPSRRFFDRGGEPADEVLTLSRGGRASAVGGGRFGFVECDGAVERREKEFCVATLGGATGVANDTFLRFPGIFKHQKKGVEEGYICVCVCVYVCSI